MTIQLNYNAIEEFTSAEMNDYTEPPLIYRVWRNRPQGWTDAAQAFLSAERARREADEPQNGQNAALALEVVGLSLVSVTDDAQTHAIGSVKKARELKKVVEQATDMQYSDRYIAGLADVIITKQIEREDRLLGELKKSSPPSDVGAVTEPSNGKTAQPIPSTETS